MLLRVSIIAARGGSKGIPKKNLHPFCGQPLLYWSIQQALRAGVYDSVWVTSDSQEILDYAQSNGAQPIVRPEHLSGDRATSESAWLHALDFIENQKGKVKHVTALQATSPLRRPEDLRKAVNLFEEQQLDSLFSASPIGDFYIWTKSKSGELQSLNYDFQNRTRRQEFADQYVENGSFYIFNPELIRKNQNRLGGKIGISEMEFWQSFEVDGYDSLKMCEILMKGYLL